MRVYAYRKNFYALGDIWASVSDAIHNMKDRSEIYFSEGCSDKVKSLILEIVPLLKISPSVRFVKPTQDTIVVNEYCVQSHHKQYIPTKVQWKDRFKQRSAKRIKTICCQLDNPRNRLWNSERFLDAKFMNKLKRKEVNLFGKVEFVHLGKPMNLKTIIETIAESEHFIGIDSGISHLCHSVGLPNTFIKYFKNRDGLGHRHDIHFYHPNKKYHTFKKFIDLENSIDREIS